MDKFGHLWNDGCEKGWFGSTQIRLNGQMKGHGEKINSNVYFKTIYKTCNNVCNAIKTTSRELPPEKIMSV